LHGKSCNHNVHSGAAGGKLVVALVRRGNWWSVGERCERTTARVRSRQPIRLVVVGIEWRVQSIDGEPMFKECTR
jgi:hypothetical protein